MTIDHFIDDDGNELDNPYGGADSVWNFHVWNETWMKRNDLPDGDIYDGWQACDATPQESSNGMSQCGPCPVTAIKSGKIFVGFDTGFLYSEVNADECYWHQSRTGEVELVKRDTKSIGHKISTKAVGTWLRHDVTHNYKNEEGSEAERQSHERAYAHGARSVYHQNHIWERDSKDLDVEISVSLIVVEKISKYFDYFNF